MSSSRVDWKSTMGLPGQKQGTNRAEVLPGGSGWVRGSVLLLFPAFTGHLLAWVHVRPPLATLIQSLLTSSGSLFWFFFHFNLLSSPSLLLFVIIINYCQCFGAAGCWTQGFVLTSWAGPPALYALVIFELGFYSMLGLAWATILPFMLPA
jgi:hypothetical protein